MIRLSKSSIGDLEKTAVASVLDRAFLGMGPEVARFEEELSEFFGRPAVCVVNGTAALHLALQAIGLESGDEVLVQSLTYLSSFQAISSTGAKPVACDVESNTLTLDWRDAERRITPQTKAIMPVHYAGGVGDIDKIYQFAKQHGLRVIEDAAHAFGSIHGGRRVGSFGDVACFSFDGIKNITSGEGGCIVTDSEEVLSAVRDARLLGVKGDSKQRQLGDRTWIPEVDRQGWRYHMSDMMAAIGRVQLERLCEFARRRRQQADRYQRNLKEVKQVKLLEYDLENIVPHIYVIRLLPLIKRETVRASLKEKNIQTGIHYYPNHLLDYFRDEQSDDLSCTDVLADQVLSLPLHYELTDNEIDYICDTLISILKSGRRR